MKCHLVLDPNSHGWVIEKMCRRLGAELEGLGCEVTIGDAPDATADINHFMLFWWVPENPPPRSTVAITHIDDSHRMYLARSAVTKADMVICMSSMTVKQLVNDGLPREKMCYVLPAFDGVEPRRIVIGLTTRIYPDGRKREYLLERLAMEMDLSAFHFDIYGAGWERMAEVLRKGGATVAVTVDSDDGAADYRRIMEGIQGFDYYLYLGLDEGSMGTLDALAAGVKTIVTPQGFHVDLPHGITHPFWDYEQLRLVFESIRDDRDGRILGVKDLTWRRYAERHRFIWQAMLDGRAADLPALLGQETLAPLGGYAADQDAHMHSEKRRLFWRSLWRYHLPRWRSRLGGWLRGLLPLGLRRRIFGTD